MTINRTILSIHDGNDSSAALMIDGAIVAACQEDRFSGLKMDVGLPCNAIDYCLKIAKESKRKIDEIVLIGHKANPVISKLKRVANFSVNDWVKEQHLYWKPKMFEGKINPYYKIFENRDDFRYDEIYPTDHLLEDYSNISAAEEFTRIRKETLAKYLNVSEKDVIIYTHEVCHAFYGYFGSPIRSKALSFTAEGVGDYSNGTLALFSCDGREELASTLENHLGHIYQYITLILGMKPSQHEYKVMGLAPYANTHEVEKSIKVFKDILQVKDLNVVFNKKPKDLYFYFRDALEGHRFDGIAGAVQNFLEDILCEWVKTAIEKTGVRVVTFSGGVSQNIKACKRIGEIDLVDNIYICPAAGDTSLSVGGCYNSMHQYLKDNQLPIEENIKPMDTMYLGPEYSNDFIDSYIEKNDISQKYKIVRNVSPELIAQTLANGNILARCSGRMEFGVRALGNRSILADPRKSATVHKINAAIKFRDFWMPFTPTILSERAIDYIQNPKNLECPHMTMAFDSTDLAREHIPAGIHQADFTMRPQILEKHHNPSYYKIIKEFEKITGVGALLNTSFNLHGDAIVLGPKEAFYTLENSALDGLILEDFLFLRK